MGSRGDDLSVGVFSLPPLIIWGTAAAWWERIVRFYLCVSCVVISFNVVCRDATILHL